MLEVLVMNNACYCIYYFFKIFNNEQVVTHVIAIYYYWRSSIFHNTIGVISFIFQISTVDTNF